MVRRRLIFIALAAILFCGSAEAGPDFYGVKMKGEDFAQNLVLRENNLIPNFSNDRAGTDKRVYAYGFVSSWIGGSKGVSVRVYNHSDKPISTQRVFRDMILVTRSGERYDRSEAEMMYARRMLEPGENATFNFKFPGIRVPKEDVRMIICSFDLGRTTIYLLPLTQEGDAKGKAAERGKRPGFLDSLKMWFEPEQKKKPAEAEAKKPEGVEEGKDKALATYPLIKAEQVIDGATYNFRPEHRKDVASGQKDVEERVFRDRPWSLDDPDKYLEHQESYEFPRGGLPRRMAQVVVVNDDYGFVVVNAGFNDGFDKNVILDVLRNGRKIGKVMITKPRDKVAGAMILREWKTKDQIRTGDLVGISE